MPPEKRSLAAPLFERQDDEGDEAWLAFRTYRDMGLARTLDAVREKCGYKPESARLIERWSSEWSWGLRTSAWDKHLDRARRAAHEAAVVEMSERQAKDAMLLQDGIRPIIKALHARSQNASDELEDLGTVAALLKDLTPAMKAAVEAERRARGLDDLKVNVQGAVVLEGLRQAFTLRQQRARGEDGMHVGDEAPGAEPDGAPAGEPVASP